MKTRSLIPGFQTFDYNWLEQGAGSAAMSVCDSCLGKALGSLERVSVQHRFEEMGSFCPGLPFAGLMESRGKNRRDETLTSRRSGKE